MWAVLIIELLILVGICGLILRTFASFKKTPWYALATTWLGWLLCFAIVFLVPIDIIDTDHENCVAQHPQDTSQCTEPTAYLPPPVMKVQWSVLYWGTFIMSWLGFPLLQTYSLAGDFTTWEKVVRSIKENIFLYIGMAIVGVIFLVALAAAKKLAGAELLNLVMALANAYGLILVVVLMGYGLVDIPRYLFRKASRNRTLEHYYAQAFKLKETRDSAKEDLNITLKLVKKVADRVNDHDPYRQYVDRILKKCPLEYDDVTTGDGDADVTYDKLVQLNCRVKEDVHKVARSVTMFEMLLRKGFAIEDLLRLKEQGGSPDHKMHYSFRPPRTHKYANYVDTIEYYWEMHLHPIWYYTLAAGATLLSLLIVWCELTLVAMDKVDLSPFSHLISAMHMAGFGKQLFCFIPLAYMAVCAYTTLFKIKLFNYYRLVPHQQSDANSIMFSANYLCRLAAPLSFNFLKLVNQQDNSFRAVMGEMDAFPFLGKDFLIFFPIFVAVFCLFTIMNVWQRMASMCCIKRFRYVPDDDHNLVTEGEKILKEERDVKEGRGPTDESFKQSIKRNIKDVTRKILRKDDEKEAPPPNSAPMPIAAAPSAPLTNAEKMRNKYATVRYEDGADLLPASSKFATISSSTSSKSGRSNYDDLLPANSRFSSKNSAIVDIISSEPDATKAFTKSTHTSSSSSSTTAAAQKSMFGGLFGKGGRRNDEVGLLPRDDSNV